MIITLPRKGLQAFVGMVSYLIVSLSISFENNFREFTTIIVKADPIV